MNRRWIGVLVVVALCAGGLFLFREQLETLNQENLIRLSYLLLLAILVGSGAFAFREKVSVQVRNGLIWLLILFGVIGVYSMRDQFAAILNPSAPRAVGDAIELRRGGDGHFWADVEINGVSMRMMIDTGASTVALTQHDARRIGLDVNDLRYVVPVSTANGNTFAAPVALDRISVGGIRVDNVEAAVMQENSDVSLLGMSFLNQLSSYSISGETLRLTP